MTYEDFVIQVGGRREEGHAVRVLKSPAGEGRSSFKLALSPAQINAILTPHGGAVRGVPAGEPVEPGRDLRMQASDAMARLAAQQVGDQLFRGLFSGQVKSLYDQSLGSLSSRAGCGLRIKLKFDAQDQDLAQLISVPWEFLWRGETRDFLSLSRLSPVVRYLDVPRPAAPILLESALRVLVVVSSPRGLQALDVRQERANLEAACQSWKGVEVTVLEGADSAAIRRHLLEKPFHVLHFIGHGGFDPAQGEGVLFFERPDGQPEPVTGQSLATFLKDFKTLGLVFLNACDTARADSSGVNPFSGVAGALVLGGLPAVVAMQFPISDRAAIAFSMAFYQRLAIGDPVDASVVEGRQAILAAVPGTHEWGTPVLFLRVPDGTVFQSPASAGEGSGGRRWPKVLMAVLLAALLGALCVPAFETLADRLAGRRFLEIDQQFGSSVNGLSGVLATAELQPNGRMRLNFRFRNSSAKQVGLGFDYRSTYLADGEGNEYKVLATDATAESAVDSIPPGGEIERWLEFPAPLDRARKFHVALAGRDPAKAQFSFFTVDLSRYLPALSRSMPAAKPTPDALAVSCSIATSVAGFKGELRSVELRKDGRMRWRFDFLNGSNRDQPIGFDYSAIHLVDEHGNRYPVLGSDTGGQPGQVFRNRLPRAVRRGYWFDFPAPRNGAWSFTVVLASPDNTGPRFIPCDVRIPFYFPEYAIRKQPAAPLSLPARIETVSKPEAAPSLTPPPPPRVTVADTPPPAEAQEPAKPAARPAVEPPKLVTHTAEQEAFETNIDGLSGRLAAVEVVSDCAAPMQAKISGKNKKKEYIPFVASGSWEAYIHDNEGRDRTLVQPVEQNDDQDWMFLKFTDYKGPRGRLAILRVENKSLNPQSEGDDEDGKAEVPLQQIEDLFSMSLFNTNRFTLIERKRIQSAMAEQDFGASDRINAASAVKVGKLLGADYLIIVAVNEWTPKKNGFGAMDIGQFTAEVALSFRVINAASGKLTLSCTERATASSVKFAAGKQASISYSLQSCLNKGAYRLATFLKPQPWRGSVADIKGNKVYINDGSNRGIETSMKLTALSKGEAVIDPETHQPLGNDTEAIGTLMVTTVNETFSIAAISQGCKGLKKGDQVEIAAAKF
jgi:hypothetical protein